MTRRSQTSPVVCIALMFIARSIVFVLTGAVILVIRLLAFVINLFLLARGPKGAARRRAELAQLSNSRIITILRDTVEERTPSVDYVCRRRLLDALEKVKRELLVEVVIGLQFSVWDTLDASSRTLVREILAVEAEECKRRVADAREVLAAVLPKQSASAVEASAVEVSAPSPKRPELAVHSFPLGSRGTYKLTDGWGSSTTVTGVWDARGLRMSNHQRLSFPLPPSYTLRAVRQQNDTTGVATLRRAIPETTTFAVEPQNKTGGRKSTANGRATTFEQWLTRNVKKRRGEPSAPVVGTHDDERDQWTRSQQW